MRASRCLAMAIAFAVMAGCASHDPSSTTSPSAGTTTAAACQTSPALTQGPYFLDGMPERRDIRSDSGGEQSGTPFHLLITVMKKSGSTCTGLADAKLDVWHANAFGKYSGVEDQPDRTYLRGYQTTDAQGVAEFDSILPGWYPGRAVHIHFKVRSDASSFTSQWFIEDTVTAQAFRAQPYAARGSPDTSNAQDSLYNNGGSSLILDVEPEGQGYVARFTVVMP